MSSDLINACHSILGLVRDVMEDLVMDHPWGWTGLAFIVGLLFGRKKMASREEASS
ncbi:MULTISPECIES: hypothetical protein [Bombella]|uniref:Uncharacterized protein n=1 Tax=Bombella pollinis TaxID=2967337 RepID=A0ABT3WM36_9PROT|nr:MULTISPECIES: hypothetical protein [Bombella]MCX5620202.1 hypothetical protein [Bombella pollinis]MUG90581.1 hypothetical protein [Bombella sp. ESL0385]